MTCTSKIGLIALATALIALPCLALVLADRTESGPPAVDTHVEMLEGSVESVLAAGSYTYIELADEDGSRRWVVLSGNDFRDARWLKVRSFGHRRDFLSKRLGRSFSELYFGSVISSKRESI